MRGTRVSVLVVLVLFCCKMSTEGKGYKEAFNCKQLECPKYEVMHTGKQFEVRKYEVATWMSTPTINSTSYSDAVARGFNLLFAYIQGNNYKSAKIEMTAPVLVDVHPSTGPFCNSTFVVNFYVPQKYQKYPPGSRQLRPAKLPRQKYGIVRRFGGFMNDGNIASEALALKKTVKGTPWESSFGKSYSVAGYNSPFEYDNRVNEVIFWSNN
ncbi:hypothetical protein ACP275_11G080400 [Erythranthe tilingii]